ncbi:MAG: UDP-2,3-diacylglucosamine diphosphatase LpxI [Puniceicoccales bacterium]|jgi:DUF1009 family protein|nr:UDP-2,3-diacylglucosamine diphosphatase LpxI [Puniceicoccales bacterium]
MILKIAKTPNDNYRSSLHLQRQDSPFPKSIALLAGNGHYPQLCAQRMKALGIDIHLLALDEMIDENFFTSFPFQSRTQIHIGHIGKILKTLKKTQVSHAITAGQIQPQKLFNGLHPDLKAFWLLRKLRQKNAATIFGAISEEIEAMGIQVLDARSFMDEDLAEEGSMTRSAWKLPSHVLEQGIHITREIAKLDIGQGIVLHNGTVLCVEGFDGTDAMLQYAGRFHVHPKLFVKTSKLNQDFRFDVPVFGIKTLEYMYQNGVEYAVLEAGKTLILDKKNVLAQADDWHIHIYGYAQLKDIPS